MKWRKLNYKLHRDIGYLCIGMTLIYAVSGVAVNHISHQFNPSYTIEKAVTSIEPVVSNKEPDLSLVRDILAQLEETGKFKSVVMISPGAMRIFIEGKTIDVELTSGKVSQEKVARRPILYEVNYLHLNKPKGIWTYIADVYAVLLGLMALTGFLMIHGRAKKRGYILTGVGLMVPLFYLVCSL